MEPEKGCDVLPCLNGGKCVADKDGGNVKVCNCSGFFIGDRCEIDAGWLKFQMENVLRILN